MRQGTGVLSTLILSSAMTACAHWPGDQLGTIEPDRVLYERAVLAAQRQHLDVAAMTLQTLVNTYPDSPYSQKAEVILQDPRFSECRESVSFSGICEVGKQEDPATDANLPLEFFDGPLDKP